MLIGVYQCPVCLEEVGEFKILPCNHLLCKHCLLSWLSNSGSCPLCRWPIRCDSRSPTAVVDALPTDLATAAWVQTHDIDDAAPCDVCRGVTQVTSYCFDCRRHLCQSCSLRHPADDCVQSLSNLTSLTSTCGSVSFPCGCSPVVLSLIMELYYCQSHNRVACQACREALHGYCTRVQELQEAARQQRQELKLQAATLRCMQTTLAAQGSQAAVGNLQTCMEQHAKAAELLAETAPNDGLLLTCWNLKKRLKELETCGKTPSNVTVSTTAQNQGTQLNVNPPPVSLLAHSADYGTSAWSILRRLQVGQRVWRRYGFREVLDHRCGQDGYGGGIVIASPSDKIYGFPGFVDVRWDDTGLEGTYRSGDNGVFELKLRK